MKIIVIEKGTLNCETFSNVTNVAYSSGTVTITYSGGSTAGFVLDDYMLQFIL